MISLSQLIKKPVFIAGSVGAVLILVLGVWYFSGDDNSLYEFAVVKKGDLLQEVSVTGRIKPAEDVSLAFEKNGKISKIHVDVGDNVTIGQKLASLENSDVEAQLAQAEAGVDSAKASLLQYQATLEREEVKLDELKSGTRTEEIDILEAKVSSARKTLSDAEISLLNVEKKAETDLNNLYGDIDDILNDAYAKAEDAANKQTDELFNDDLSNSPYLSFITSNSQAETDAESKRVAATTALNSFKADIVTLPIYQIGLDNLLIRSQEELGTVRDFLIKTSDALNGATNLSQTNIASYKANISTGRTNVNTAISNITAQQQLISGQKNTNQSNISASQSQVNTAKNSLIVAEAELNLKKAGATSQQIAAQEAQVSQAKANIASGQAQVKQAEANVRNSRAQLVKTVLYAPINGVVTKQSATIGEIIAANSPIISIISKNQYEIEANMPEADISKIHIGNSSRVTLDAYPDVTFEAKVTAIDPAETIIEGVATYKITLHFLSEDDKIKSGMTANIDILSDKKENVISIPQRAVTTRNGDKFVRVLVGGAIREVPVTTGIKGSNGYIEVTDGLNEGDQVVIFSKEK